MLMYQHLTPFLSAKKFLDTYLYRYLVINDFFAIRPKNKPLTANNYPDLVRYCILMHFWITA